MSTFFAVVSGVPADRLPRRATDGAAGYDLRAWLPAPHRPLVLPAGGLVIVRTGVRTVLPPQVCGIIFGRSGYRARGIGNLGPGVIDPDFTGELRVIMHNTTAAPIEIADGERIAQIVFMPFIVADAEGLPACRRPGDAGGFGSTGQA